MTSDHMSHNQINAVLPNIHMTLCLRRLPVHSLTSRRFSTSIMSPVQHAVTRTYSGENAELAAKTARDFRSDTFTMPTDEM